MFSIKRRTGWSSLIVILQQAIPMYSVIDLKRFQEHVKKSDMVKEIIVEEIDKTPSTSIADKGTEVSESPKPTYEINVKDLKNIHSTSSSVSTTNRDSILSFKNLLFDPEKDLFFSIVKYDSPAKRIEKIDSASLDGHSAFVWGYSQLPQKRLQDAFKNRKVLVFNTRTYLFARFHGGNIMHILHDDILPHFYARRLFSGTGKASSNGQEQVFFIDDKKKIRYDDIYRHFIKSKISYKTNYANDKNTLILFKDAIVGQPKATTWYQYGFGCYQGPIKSRDDKGKESDKIVDGAIIRELIGQLTGAEEKTEDCIEKIKEIAEKKNNGSDEKVIVIFSRTLNRLILNEEELRSELERRYGTKTIYVRMEDMKIDEMIPIMKNAVMAIGMHGSILIMALFMPRNSILIEMYPYAVPSGNYTPYKHLCGLSGIDIEYRAWENSHEKNNVSHEDWKKQKGGIKHLKKEAQEKILKTKTVPPHFCCTDPYWLFRIYQDTTVEINEVFGLIDDSIDALVKKRAEVKIRPGKITELTVKEEARGNKKVLVLSWSPAINTDVSSYSVWLHQKRKEYKTKETTYIYDPSGDPFETYDFWVRGVVLNENNEELVGEYSNKREFKRRFRKELYGNFSA
eukprot:GHVP01031417.1.p1 GENE.GHVP01031417.1~~GHVP01031417.1.p1  ORF type:complete len:626 (+),score=89.03 GHVP01031417.1:436-2313(+)